MAIAQNSVLDTDIVVSFIDAIHDNIFIHAYVTSLYKTIKITNVNVIFSVSNFSVSNNVIHTLTV